MGCGQSKIDQEETVARCKDRKRFIRETVVARNGLAAAHSAYAVSLKNAGAALSDYAQGESVISEIHGANHTLAITSSSGRVAVNPPADRFLPPPHPGSSETMDPLQRSSSEPLVAVSKNKGKAPMNASVTEEEDGDDGNVDELMPGSVPSVEMHGESVPPLSLHIHETAEYVFQDTTNEYPYKPVLDMCIVSSVNFNHKQLEAGDW
jgi:Protein of unknown function (DUF630)